jgi:hypothetical protein
MGMYFNMLHIDRKAQVRPDRHIRKCGSGWRIPKEEMKEIEVSEGYLLQDAEVKMAKRVRMDDEEKTKRMRKMKMMEMRRPSDGHTSMGTHTRTPETGHGHVHTLKVFAPDAFLRAALNDAFPEANDSQLWMGGSQRM